MRAGPRSSVGSATRSYEVSASAAPGPIGSTAAPHSSSSAADGNYLVGDAGLGAPIVQELVERLSDLRLCAAGRAIVVVPLREGALERVRELVANGPPFEPGETVLTRHELLLTPSEAIFVFESETEEGLGAFLSRLDLSAAAAWGELVAGPPRLAECAFSWERPELPGVGLGF